jgi:hypothetical protein
VNRIPDRSTIAGSRYLDLRRVARATGRPTDELLQLYALESFLGPIAAGMSTAAIVPPDATTNAVTATTMTTATTKNEFTTRVHGKTDRPRPARRQFRGWVRQAVLAPPGPNGATPET